jgi:hypothetical protein
MKKIQLSIPEPCHEDWSKMTQEEKGRFCNSCKKTVIDFTGMSDRELIAFFKKPSGSLCGRFNREQLGRDIVIPRKRIPWVKYFFQFTWPAFAILLKSCGWKDKTVGKLSMNTEDIRNASGNNLYEIATVGVLLTEISMVDTTALQEKIDSIPMKGDLEITESVEKIEAIGMPLMEDQQYVDPGCEPSAGLVIETDTPVVSPHEMDTVFVTSDYANTMRRTIAGGISVKTARITVQEVKEDKLVEPEVFFEIYPNPISKGTLLTINLQVEKGEYMLALINGGGQTVQREKIIVAYKKQAVSFKLNEVAAGNYFMQLFDAKSGKSFTRKLVVL